MITDGGDQPNVVPSLASVWYFFREMDFENIKKNYEIGNKIAEAAAMMTDTKVTRKVIGTAAPRHFNKTLAETLQSNIERVGLPKWTDDEQTFAKAVQRLVEGKEDRAQHGGAKARAAARAAGKRRLGRHRRRVLDRADRDAALSGEHSEPARPQLVQRHRHGHADRAQGHRRRREGDGHDDDRSPACVQS